MNTLTLETLQGGLTQKSGKKYPYQYPLFWFKSVESNFNPFWKYPKLPVTQIQYPYFMQKMEKETKKTAKTATKPRRKAKPAPVRTRQRYDGDTKGEAKDLYKRGLTLERIGKYLAVPVRTLEKWQLADEWAEARNPTAAALEMHRQKFTAKDIAAKLEISVKTVRNLLKPENRKLPD